MTQSQQALTKMGETDLFIQTDQNVFQTQVYAYFSA